MSSLSLTLKPLPPTPLPNKKKLDKDYIKLYNKIQIVICHILQFLQIFSQNGCSQQSVNFLDTTLFSCPAESLVTCALSR